MGLVAAVLLVVGVTSLGSKVSTDGTDVAASAAVSQTGGAGKAVLVTYSDQGFTPAVVKVPRGTTIRFLNASTGKALRIAAVNDPSKTGGAQSFEFNSSQSVKRGDSFETSANTPGVWAYKNLNAPNAIGVAIVE